MKIRQTKVSGTGWLCAKMPDGTWLPIFKLSPEQQREYNEVAEAFSHWEKGKHNASD